tara:strand:- start:960 stop:1382 length:423 start_codon:yes stop_codon:yes gene_type:complete
MEALLRLARNGKQLTIGKVFVLTFSNPNLKSLVISLNHDQLKMGELADDTFIQEYSQGSIDYYEKRPGRFTLYDTGAFYNSFKVLTVNEDAIVEFADTEKPDKDLLEYGEVIGLNGESLSILIKEALPIMRDILLGQLQK